MMKLRAPAVPLVTVDPYFSIWSMNNQLNGDVTRHWTGKQHRLTGIIEVDGNSYCFMGISEFTSIKQKKLKIDALTTEYIFETPKADIVLDFISPLLMDDPMSASRPVNYITAKITSKDKKEHHFTFRLIADDEICLDHKGQWDTAYSAGKTDGYLWGSLGSIPQRILNKSGDDLRIDWGYLYLAAPKNEAYDIVVSQLPSAEKTQTKSSRLQLKLDFVPAVSVNAVTAIAYDDVKSIEYFGEPADPYWKTESTPDIHSVLSKALSEYHGLISRCRRFSQKLYKEAEDCGGREYAELVSLAYRQSAAAHKLCKDKEGNLLFISKECFSNGCAATVDVSYPSSPLFLLYNPDLVKGMLRPIFRYASSSDWKYEFAPHDAGQYPKVNGQVYGDNKPEYQMPVEECGNILIMVTSVCIVQNDIGFASENWPLLVKWANYLQKTGMDPENQLCTDDFAGHLAHNCNLAIKAILGIAGFSVLCRMKGDYALAEKLLKEARGMAGKWITMAANKNGTFRLSFDKEDSYSMKYNLIWDKLWGTGIFDLSQFGKEFASYLKHSNQFGMPLDNRADYTKSDWLVWCAALMETKEDFIRMIEPLYAAYHNSVSRIPMSDWYDTKTAKSTGFQNRTVQGGLFVQLLISKGSCKVKE